MTRDERQKLMPTDGCDFRSPDSNDGYCACVLPRDHDGNHRCIHGLLDGAA